MYPSVERVESALSMFENQAFNSHYDVDYSDPAKLILTSNQNVEFMPVIVGECHVDNDGNFWYSPTMTFPTPISEEMTSGAHFTYYLEDWVKAAKLADYLLDHSWVIDVED